MPLSEAYVPDYIRVHLGAPSASAQNATVSFPTYIKNVASSEIYPTWEEAAIRANILAQISFALNRVYVEHYPSLGYDFDITNSTAFDQSYFPGRNIFENISALVDEIFNDYIKRPNFYEPLSAKYCNGTTTTCDGMSQWGSQELAKQGVATLDILKNYYGNNLEIVYDAVVRGIEQSYPGTPLRLGSSGSEVTQIQSRLNVIARNYPAIPQIEPVNGTFDQATENSVEAFQRIFSLAADGIVGKATWYKLVFLYATVLRLSELNSLGQTLFINGAINYPDAVRPGETGRDVTVVQFFISVISDFYITVPRTKIDGIYGTETTNAVRGFQLEAGLSVTGVVNGATWDSLYNYYRGTIRALAVTLNLSALPIAPFPGTDLALGTSGESVSLLQRYLTYVSSEDPTVLGVSPTGEFDDRTRLAVASYQREYGLPITGTVDRATWNSLTSTVEDIQQSQNRFTTFPGNTLTRQSAPAMSRRRLYV